MRQPTEETLKENSTSLAIGETHIKTMLRFHFTPPRMAIKNKNDNKYWGRDGARRLLIHWKCKFL